MDKSLIKDRSYQISEWNSLMDFIFGKAFADRLELVYKKTDGFKTREINSSSCRDFFIQENLLSISDDGYKHWLKKNPFASRRDFPNRLDKIIARLEHELIERFSVSQFDINTHKEHFYRQFEPTLEKGEYKFIGRSEDVKDLRDHFSRSDIKGVCITKSISGIGGMGKTVLAKHYAINYANDYAEVIFLDGRNNNLLQQLIIFLQKKGIDIPPETYNDAFKSLFTLYPCKKILLIIDDVIVEPAQGTNRSAIENQIDKMLVAISDNPNIKARTHMLLTSRSMILTKSIAQKKLDKMSCDDAIELFQDRRGHDNDEVSEVRTIVFDFLNGHPLSICLVASYAAAQGLDSLIPVIQYFQKHSMMNMPATTHESLRDYPRTLEASLSLSFNALTDTSKYYLLLLSLFRRAPISRMVIRQCMLAAAKYPWHESLQGLLEVLTNKSGGVSVKNDLKRYCLLESSAKQVSRKDEAFQLHEVIFDYCHTHWGQLVVQGEAKCILGNLEQNFSKGAAAYITSSLNDNSLDYWDVFSLSGVLIPAVRPTHSLYPSYERVIKALQFWYTHFHFQNYIYDTGIQPALLDRLHSLENYIDERQITLSPAQRLVLCKLIAHIYYATPKDTPDEIMDYFEQALQLVGCWEQQHGADACSQWYRIFILDHRSNAASKKLTIEDSPKHSYFFPDIEAIESVLPEGLKNIKVEPNEKDKNLILRAAHYWGHRGNQEASFAKQAFFANPAEISRYAQHSITAYALAINYRLAALKYFSPDVYEQRLSKHLKDAPLLAHWLNTLQSLDPEDAERFTSLSQAIGDIAHQYRGINFVLYLKYLAAGGNLDKENYELLSTSYCYAENLWKAAKVAQTPGETPLKYKLWMASTRVWMQSIGDGSSPVSFPPKTWQQDFDLAIEDISEELGIRDENIVTMQTSIFKEIYK